MCLSNKLTATHWTISPSTKIITHDHPPDRGHCGLSWTLRMGLRIRRLGVRIPPGAPVFTLMGLQRRPVRDVVVRAGCPHAAVKRGQAHRPVQCGGVPQESSQTSGSSFSLARSDVEPGGAESAHLVGVAVVKEVAHSGVATAAPDRPRRRSRAAGSGRHRGTIVDGMEAAPHEPGAVDQSHCRPSAGQLTNIATIGDLPAPPGPRLSWCGRHQGPRGC